MIENIELKNVNNVIRQLIKDVDKKNFDNMTK